MDLLPIGTIVRLKSGQKDLMIIGRCQVKGDDKKIWDYVGCLHPEGILNDEFNFLFNNEDIDNVICKGYVSVDEADTLKKLEIAVQKYKQVDSI